jgi:nitrite reductase/ring-hydroxylating ferredoxin subunit/uncharacterized membrane protein
MAGASLGRIFKRREALGRRLAGFWEEQAGLDEVAAKLQDVINRVAGNLPGGNTTKDLLHGTTIGHPLHPILTDVPIGAFTFATFFDLLSLGRRPSNTATALLGIGLAAVPPTALAGAMDWEYTGGAGRRVGLGHAAMNSVASLFFGASLLARLTGSGPARLLNFAGFGALMASAYLGGHLVFDKRIGVKYESQAKSPQDHIAVLPEASLVEGSPVRVEANGYPIVLYRYKGRIHALADACPHLGCSLAEGEAAGEEIACSCHGSAFSVVDGAVLRGPSAFSVDAFAVRVRDGNIEVGPLE